MNTQDKALVTLLAVSLLLALIAIPLVRRKVPRNPFYGYRTRATLGDENLWRAANAHFGRGLIAATAGGCLLALSAYAFVPLPAEVAMPVYVLLLALPSLAATLATGRFIRRWHDANPPGRKP